ncbi:magnesium transporter MgtC [Flavobacterium kingsejongi]|uniref:Protein MgtC n=2 Tax=Flavobacterium kingsejongi TaxID=1678728 RepID=A0A2S1LUM8_9FLAO|nr:magnesium transporter MgtC [Flavobacterium kingsejongi]
MPIFEFALRLGWAAALGVTIGFERQWRQKSAGLRTNTLVSLGAAAFILLSVSITGESGDPGRIAAQIVTGIGFLGAGVIMKDGLSVQGLNTAATLWCSAAVGALAGLGLFAESFVVAIAIMLTHLFLRPVGLKMNRLTFRATEDSLYFYSFKIRCKEQVENHLRVLMLGFLKNDVHLQLRSLKSSDNGSVGYAYVEAEILANGNHDLEMEILAGKLTVEYGVTQVSWEVNGEQND